MQIKEFGHLLVFDSRARSCYWVLLLGFAESIEPVKEDSSPDDSVLWRKHPVAFLGEVQESARNTLNLCRGKGFHALSDWHPKILFSVDHKKRSLPVSDKLMG